MKGERVILEKICKAIDQTDESEEDIPARAKILVGFTYQELVRLRDHLYNLDSVRECLDSVRDMSKDIKDYLR